MAATLPRHSGLAERLNRQCACQFLDRSLLKAQLEASPGLAGLATHIAETRPHLFSATMVFISPQQRAQMQAVIRAAETVMATAAWQDAVLAGAPDIARAHFGPQGVFFGYDFHLGERGPSLIEINTNAGGAYLNLALARAQTACCAQCPPHTAGTVALQDMEAQWLAMFLAEWRLQRSSTAPRTLAIIDEAPPQQYLYPEFLLFQRLFAAAGMNCLIASPEALRHADGRLWLGDTVIDMVYNRLTDFYLEQPDSGALRAAYLAGDVVLTPTPRAHALQADKRHLARLSDADSLARLGVDAASAAVLLAGIPPTRTVTAENAGQLWAERRQLFFKPASGYGSKAAYRGDKLTRRVWADILAGDYVAQALAPPGERRVAVTGSDACEFKTDVRAYVYRGEVQLFAARLYQGQTTNFRTQGGGFAPVYMTP
ncbi:hypothetical protein [Chitinilyticum litopenaei]|uniref:hypothetical protein n=1 Tax=Chitinilyticum litopenaei TaxID=1121276 RepID=UPI0003F89B6B|nr:hypothetical protein [Chitinilyticum litopenaei]